MLLYVLVPTKDRRPEIEAYHYQVINQSPFLIGQENMIGFIPGISELVYRGLPCCWMIPVYQVYPTIW